MSFNPTCVLYRATPKPAQTILGFWRWSRTPVSDPDFASSTSPIIAKWHLDNSGNSTRGKNNFTNCFDFLWFNMKLKCLQGPIIIALGNPFINAFISHYYCMSSCMHRYNYIDIYTDKWITLILQDNTGLNNYKFTIE